MSFKKSSLIFVILSLILISSASQAQETVRIAVAANFLATLNSLAQDFTAETGIPVAISNGSSGMLYAQIIRGSPFDMFFSADAKRPQLLEEKGFIEQGSRFTYAMGKLVVWSPKPDKVTPNLAKLSTDNPNLRFVAIANPKTAPYGAAAIEVLKYYGLYDYLTANRKIAHGGNVGKAFKYVFTGNAQIGFLAKSHVANPNRPVAGEVFVVPSHLYSAITQQAVVLRGRKTTAVRAFLEFFHSEESQQKIKLYGYGLVNND